LDRELWEAVQVIESETRKTYATSAKRPDRGENIFKGYVICAVCNSKMSRQHSKKVMVSGKVWEQFYYLCPIERQHPAGVSFRTIRADTVTDAVLPLVVEKLQSAANLGAVIEKRMKQQANPRAALDSEIARASRELETINMRLAGLYESYVDKLLTESEYVGMKSEYESRIESLRDRMDELSRRASVMSDVSASDNRWLKAARDFQNPTVLTREMVEALIERIEVNASDRVDVVWRFADEFELLKKCASQGKEAV
jgi:predicted  nucleic acid-binding Zn-ribbon protein